MILTGFGHDFMKHAKILLPLFLVVLIFSGCASDPQQGARNVSAGMAVTGAAGGALIGNVIKPGDPLAVAGGAAAGLVAGGAAGSYYTGQVSSAFDQGYLQGQSDNIKRTYWILQNANVGGADTNAGRTVFYTMPGPVETVDGRKLVTHTITVPIVE